MSNFVVWRTKQGPQFCVLTGVCNVPDYWELGRGVSRASGFPEDACFEMDPNFPKDVVLPDNVQNLTDLIVVSPRVKELVEAEAPPETEYLRVRIINHKGRVAADDYWIVNPLSVQDCIDFEQSKVIWNAIDPTLISSCRRLVLDEARIDPERPLFRIQALPDAVFVHRSLAGRLRESGATGIRFMELEDFRG